MRRKIIKQGLGAYTITLPKKWIDFTQIKAGDEVSINEAGKTLIIEAEQSQAVEERKAVLNYNNYKEGEHLRSFLGSLYRGGYDTIVINYDDMSVQEKVHKAIQSMYGFEIVEFNKSFCVIKNVGLEADSDISKFLRKLVFVVENIQNLVKDVIFSSNFENEQELRYLRTSAIKLKDLSMRIVAKQKLFDNSSLTSYLVVEKLWQIVRANIHIYDLLKESKKIFKSTQKNIEYLSKYLQESLSFKKITSEQNRKDYISLKTNIEKALEKAENSEINAYLLQILIYIHSINSKLEIIRFEM